jgi:hypothetical protein
MEGLDGISRMRVDMRVENVHPVRMSGGRSSGPSKCGSHVIACSVVGVVFDLVETARVTEGVSPVIGDKSVVSSASLGTISSVAVSV